MPERSEPNALQKHLDGVSERLPHELGDALLGGDVEAEQGQSELGHARPMRALADLLGCHAGESAGAPSAAHVPPPLIEMVRQVIAEELGWDWHASVAEHIPSAEEITRDLAVKVLDLFEIHEMHEVSGELITSEPMSADNPVPPASYTGRWHYVLYGPWQTTPDGHQEDQ